MLRAFSGPFKLAIALWPLASLALTLPVLALVYHRRGRVTLASLAWSYLAVLYALGVACFTLYPMPEGTSGPGITYGVAPQLHPFAFVGDIRNDGLGAVFQVVANVALFMPFGYMLAYGLRWRVPAVAASGFAVSLLVECAQLTGFFGLYPYAYRTFDVDDLMANTAGALVGLACAKVVGRVVGRGDYVAPPVTHSPGFVRRCVAAVIDLGLCFVGAALAAAVAAFAMWNLLPGSAPGSLEPRLALAGVSVTASNVASVAVGWVFVGSRTALLLVVELLVPVGRHGSTPGGAFVRMSCETRARTGWRRALFYSVRLFVFLCLFTLPCLAPGNWLLVPLVCVALYPFLRSMPYDLLPGAEPVDTALS